MIIASGYLRDYHGVKLALKDPISKKQLTPEQVMQTLAEDLGMTNTRPGSWEGSNMQQVIDGHGWEITNSN